MITARRLQRILHLKERVRDARRAALVVAEVHVHAASAHLAEVEGRIESLAAAACRTGDISAGELHGAADLLVHERRLHENAIEALRAQEVERDVRAAAVHRANREIRSLEVLDGRQRLEQVREEGHREQLLADEHANRRGGIA